jgi:hypothetical protein
MGLLQVSKYCQQSDRAILLTLKSMGGWVIQCYPASHQSDGAVSLTLTLKSLLECGDTVPPSLKLQIGMVNIDSGVKRAAHTTMYALLQLC